MLTKEQEKQLKSLTNHKKFGKLLKAAILGWKKTEPTAKTFGLIFKENKFVADYRNVSCLLGAALLNKKAKTDYNMTESYSLECQKRYSLNAKEIRGLTSGFDNRPYDKQVANRYSFLFAQKVRKIVNPKDWVW